MYFDADQQGQKAAIFVKQLGKAAPGAQTAAGDVFSRRAFLTNYNKLRKTFSNLDLDESALANPEDLQRRINRGSERVMQELEKLSDPNQFDEAPSSS